MTSVFVIIRGDLPGTFIWQDDRCVVFMSINPIEHGHALVVPRDEIDQWIDLPSDLREHLFESHIKSLKLRKSLLIALVSAWS